MCLINEVFDGQIYLDELFRDHDVASEIPEKGSPPCKESWSGC